jgi:hypothetical protein
MFNVDYPDDLKYYNDLECTQEAWAQYLKEARDSLSTTRWRYPFDGLDYLLDDVVGFVDEPYPKTKTADQRQSNREAYVRHWQPLIDAIETFDAQAIGDFILYKIEAGLLKDIEYDLIAERDARQEM